MTVNIPRNFLFCPPHACFSHTTATDLPVRLPVQRTRIPPTRRTVSTCAPPLSSSWTLHSLERCNRLPRHLIGLTHGAQRVERQWAEFKLLIRPAGAQRGRLNSRHQAALQSAVAAKNKQSTRWAGLESMSPNQNPPVGFDLDSTQVDDISVK